MQVKTYASVRRLSNYFKPNILYKFKNSQIHVAKSLNNCREREDDFWQEIRTSMRYHFENLCCAIHFPPKIRCRAPESQLTVPKIRWWGKSGAAKAAVGESPRSLNKPVPSPQCCPSPSYPEGGDGTSIYQNRPWHVFMMSVPQFGTSVVPGWATVISLCEFWGAGASFPTRKEICERNFILVTKESDRRKRNSPLKSEVISGYRDGGPKNHPYSFPSPWGRCRPIGKGGSLPYEVRQSATNLFMTSTFLLGMATLKAEKTSPRLFWLMLALKRK